MLRSTIADGGSTPGAIISSDLTVACGTGAVRLTEVQRAGKQPTKTADFLRGVRPATGLVLG